MSSIRRDSLTPQPVVLTREPGDNAPLRGLLEAQGIPVLEWPALAPRLIPPHGGRASVEEALRRATWVIFTSRRAVEAASSVLGGGACLGAALAGRGLAAVGPSTARALARCAVEVDLTGDGQGADLLVPELLDRISIPARALLVRSAAAGREFPDRLVAAGLEVEDLRLHGPGTPAPVQEPPRPLGAIVAASPSAARRILEWNPWTARVPWVAIGPTTARSLSGEHGVKDIQLARGTGPEALLAAVCAALFSEEGERDPGTAAAPGRRCAP